jgi:hypothetical protein
MTPVSGGHGELFPRVLDSDDGFDEIADGDRHARQQTVKSHRDLFEIINHRNPTLVPAKKTCHLI